MQNRERFNLTLLTQPRWLMRGVLLAFVLIGILYSIIVPSWEAPDEIDHFRYAQYLQTQRALPVQQPHGVATAHHPPLFYVLAALVSWPVDISDGVGAFNPNPKFLFAWKGGHELNHHLQSTGDTFPYTSLALSLHLMRWLSLLFGAGAVWLTFKLANELWPDREYLSCLAAAWVAFNPQFLFISAGAMNDSLLVMMSTGLFLSLARAARQPQTWQHWLAVGVWTSLAMLSKISGLAFMPLGGLLLIICAVRQRSFHLFIRNGLALAVPVIALTGWWFVRNLNLYGDVLGNNAWLKHFPGALRHDAVDWPATAMQQLRSAWAVFGWMTVAAPTWYFNIVWGVLGVAVIGLVVYGFKQLRAPRFEGWGVLGCVVLVIYQIGLMVRENLQWTTASQGRYLFPVIAPTMIVISLGWATLFAHKRLSRYVLTTLPMLMMGLAVFLAVAVIGPNFRMQNRLPRSSLWRVRNPTQVNFGGQLGLRAYDVDTTQANQLHLKLYWRALTKPAVNYSSFAHVLRASDAPDAKPVGQKDQVPGASTDYAPANWNKDDLVLDERDIQLNQPLSNGDYVIRLGVYNYASGERLPVQSTNQAAPDYVLLKFSVPSADK